MAKKKSKQKISKERKAKSATRVSRTRTSRSRSSNLLSLSKHLPVILLVVITAIAMGPVAFNDFISLDDTKFITENPIVQNGDVSRALSKQLYSPHYKPLVYLGWIAETALFGNNPYVLHADNLLLHLISTILVFFCAFRLAQFWSVTKENDKAIAFFTALLFGIHPLHVESVAWAIERNDVLFSVFYMGGLLCYLKFIQEGQKKYLYFTALLYMFSLLSKSMGITLIAMTFLIDWASGRRDWKKMVMEKWALLLPLIIALYLYGFLFHPTKPGGASIAGFGEGAIAPPANIAALPGFYQQILIAIFRYLFFFIHTLVPAKLALVYPRESILGWAGPFIHLTVVIAGVIAALPWMIRAHRDLLLTGLVFFTVGLVPILVEEGPGTNFGSDRYTYISSIGLFFLVSAFFTHYLKKQIGNVTLGKLSLGILSCVLAVVTFFQAQRWGSSFELYDQAVKNYSNNRIALHYRGGANEEISTEAALSDYTASIELNPNDYRPIFARGTLSLKLLRYNEAITDLTRTIELKPNYLKAWVNRGNAYRDMNQLDPAIEDYDMALEMNRGYRDRETACKALNNRGAAYLKKGMYSNAQQDFDKVLELDPKYVNGYINRAALNINSNVQRYQLAIQDYDAALALEPNNVQARYYRGVALRYLSRNAEALEDFNQAIALNPNVGLYYYSRAQVLRLLGRDNESRQDARKAKSLGYDVPADYLQ